MCVRWVCKESERTAGGGSGWRMRWKGGGVEWKEYVGNAGGKYEELMGVFGDLIHTKAFVQ